MRSRESANSTMIRLWVPKVMRSGNRKYAATASSHGNASGQRRWWRSIALMPVSGVTTFAAKDLLAPIKPRRLDEEDQYRDCIDEESAGVGVEVLAPGVEDPKHDRRHQCALEATQPADGNHKQEKHEIDDGKARRQTEQRDRQPAADRRQSAADGKGEREQSVDIDPDRLRHPPIVDRGANLRPEVGALEAVPEQRNQDRANGNQQCAIDGKRPETDINLAAEIVWQMDRLGGWSIDVGEGRDRHEGEPDREQHLIELGRLVKT